jgi:hypothetical protein
VLRADGAEQTVQRGGLAACGCHGAELFGRRSGKRQLKVPQVELTGRAQAMLGIGHGFPHRLDDSFPPIDRGWCFSWPIAGYARRSAAC